MRVALRNPLTPEGCDYRHSLTVGGEYEVIGFCIDCYQLLNDMQEPVLYEMACFEVVDPTEPAFWVSEFGDEGERYAGPPEWSRPGYFEKWHDDDPAVLAAFAADLPRLYPWTAAQRIGRFPPPAGS